MKPKVETPQLALPKIRTSVKKKNEGSSIFHAEEVTNSARRLLDGDTLIQQCKDICSEYIKLYSHYASFSYVIQFFMQGIDTTPVWKKNLDQLQSLPNIYTVELGNKELFDNEQIGIKEPFPVTNLPFIS